MKKEIKKKKNFDGDEDKFKIKAKCTPMSNMIFVKTEVILAGKWLPNVWTDLSDDVPGFLFFEMKTDR